MQNRKQAKLIEEDAQNKKALEDQIAADKLQLASLKKELATLQGGV
jgi:hypothetical protein